MLRLFARLFASLLLLLSFSVFAAWAWDNSDHTSGAQPSPAWQTDNAAQPR